MKIAVIGGDPEKPSISTIHEKEIEELKTFDAIYLGVVGHPDIALGCIISALQAA